MEVTEKIIEHAKNGKVEVIIRKGEAKQLLPEKTKKEARPLQIFGDIHTVYNFLLKRAHLYDVDESHIHINLKEGTIIFSGNECRKNDEYTTSIVGQIEKHKKFKYLETLIEDSFEPNVLAKHLRRIRNWFIDDKQFIEMYQALTTFKASIEREIEKSDNRSGNMNSVIKQKAVHNLPKNFSLVVPIIKGQENKAKIDIEIDVDAYSLTCTLFVLDLDEIYENSSRQLIDNELDAKIDNVALKDMFFTYFK